MSLGRKRHKSNKTGMRLARLCNQRARRIAPFSPPNGAVACTSSIPTCAAASSLQPMEQLPFLLEMEDSLAQMP